MGEPRVPPSNPSETIVLLSPQVPAIAAVCAGRGARHLGIAGHLGGQASPRLSQVRSLFFLIFQNVFFFIEFFFQIMDNFWVVPRLEGKKFFTPDEVYIFHFLHQIKYIYFIWCKKTIFLLTMKIFY